MAAKIIAAIGCAACVASAYAQLPDHPVITEVYFDAPGVNDGPVGREPGNDHQEYIEIYLPPMAVLAPGLDKDALRLTVYEVEGDLTSSGVGLINYRFSIRGRTNVQSAGRNTADDTGFGGDGDII